MRYLVGLMCAVALTLFGCGESVCAAACGDGGLIVNMTPAVEVAYDVELDLDGVPGGFICERSEVAGWAPTNQTGSAEAVTRCDGYDFTVADTPDAAQISIRTEDGRLEGALSVSPTYAPAGPQCTWPCPLGAVVTVQVAEPEGEVFPCTEQGIRDAIAVGGGPHTFDCEGPTTVLTEAEIVIDNNVILDGEGNLIVDGNDDHRVFSVVEVMSGAVVVELRGFTVTGGHALGPGSGPVGPSIGGGIINFGDLTLTNCTVSGNEAQDGGGITNGEYDNSATLTLTNSTVSGNAAILAGGVFNVAGDLTLTSSTVSGNTAYVGGGILNVIASGVVGVVTLTNSTVSGNSASRDGGGILNNGTLILTNSTLLGNAANEVASAILNDNDGTATLTSSSIGGDCGGQTVTSNGYNIESPATPAASTNPPTKSTSAPTT